MKRLIYSALAVSGLGAVAWTSTAATFPPSRQTKKSGASSELSFRDSMMLAKIFSRYRGMKSLTQSVKGKMIINAEGVKVNAEISSTVRMAQPNRFRIDTKISFFGQEKHGSVVSDGTTVWDVDEDGKQYSEQPIASVTKNEDKFTDWLMDRGGLDLTMMFFLEAASASSLNIPKGLDKAIDVKNYPTKVVDGMAMCVVPVNIDKKSAKGSGGTATIYADAKALLVRRLRYNVKPAADKAGPKNVQVDFVFFYENVKPNGETPEGAFAFTPPDGAVKVKKVNPVFDRAFDQ